MGNEDQFGNDQENDNYLTSKASNFNAKKSEKNWFGGPSEETRLASLHALRAFSDSASHFLIEKGLKYPVTGKKNNDPLEHRFSVRRCLGGDHLALEVPVLDCN